MEKKLGRLALPNLTVYLIAGQTVVYVLRMTGKIDATFTYFAASLALQGEWWRALTFLFDPPVSNPLFALFAWYLFYLMGTALEEHWGAFRYNVFLLAGYLLTLGVSFLVPFATISNAFLGGSVFLAFAFLYPDFTIYLFFVLPVRMYWLAVLTWLWYGWLFLTGGGERRLLVLASVGNFLLFFGGDLLYIARNRGRRMARQRWQPPQRREDEPFHRCTVCGITDRSHPDMDFRYCPQCDGQRGYCRDHIFSHEHVKGKG